MAWRQPGGIPALYALRLKGSYLKPKTPIRSIINEKENINLHH